MWHRSVNYAAGTIVKRCNCISTVLCAIMHYCQTTRSWDDVCHPPSARCDLYREVHWSTLCVWYVQHSQELHTRVQYMCDQKVGVPKSWLHWPTILFPLPATLHNLASKNPGLSTNLKILSLLWGEVGNLQKITDDCASVRHLGNLGCFKKSTKNKLVNRCWDKRSESVNVRPKLVVNTQ